MRVRRSWSATMVARARGAAKVSSAVMPPAGDRGPSERAEHLGLLASLLVEGQQFRQDRADRLTGGWRRGRVRSGVV
ncbi:hypothetical protein CEJ39_15210 [Rhodococcus pyridinivorans]|nr:hypothetical protein CEJ39_15210 [Rhodococcus pyridinivorans]